MTVPSIQVSLSLKALTVYFRYKNTVDSVIRGELSFTIK